jgi:hypothetical protein
MDGILILVRIVLFYFRIPFTHCSQTGLFAAAVGDLSCKATSCLYSLFPEV